VLGGGKRVRPALLFATARTFRERAKPTHPAVIGIPASQERVHLLYVHALDAYASDTALLELAHPTAQVVEIAVAGVAIEKDGQIARIDHALEHIDAPPPHGDQHATLFL
jgi:geranylgeranyl pyrophosphate synthase